MYVKNIEQKAISMTPLVINPVGDTVVLNAPKPVSVKPVVESTERINDSPIIILPGVMASQLYADKGLSNKVWLPAEALRDATIAGGISGSVMGGPRGALGGAIGGAANKASGVFDPMDISNTLYAKPPENQHNADPREYGVIDSYKELINKLCEEFSDREIYIFSYDWRQSNIVTAGMLNRFVLEKGFSKIDLICHSMGGIVASHFIDLNSAVVNCLITLGTPFEGSTSLLEASLEGKLFGFNLEGVLDYSGLSIDRLRQFMGAKELAPTQPYVDSIPFYYEYIIPKGKSSSKYLYRLFFDDYYDLSYNYKDLLVKILPDYSSAVSNQSKIDGMGQLAKVPKRNVGISMGLRTLKSVIFSINEEDISNVSLHESNEKKLEKDKSVYAIAYSDAVTVNLSDVLYDNAGDGTVPYYSANKINLISFNARYFDSVVHSKMCDDDKCVQWTIDILKGNEPITGSPTPLASKPYTVVRVACPVDVVVSNGSQVLDSAKESLGTDFGNLNLIGKNREIKMIDLDAGNYTVQLQGTNNGTMDYSLRFFDADNAVIETRDLYDVPVTKDTLIITDTNPDDPTVLVDKKRPWETHKAQVTRHYHATSKKTPEIVKECKEFTAEDAVDLYNNAEIIDDIKTIDLSEYDSLPFDVARAWNIFAENDKISLHITSTQTIDTELKQAEQISSLKTELTNEISGNISLKPILYKTTEKSQYIEFPMVIPEDVLVVDTGQREANQQKINLSIPLSFIPFDLEKLQIYTCGIYGAIVPLESERWEVNSETISFNIVDVKNVIVAQQMLF